MHTSHLAHTMVADRRRALLAAAHASHPLAQRQPRQRRLPVARWFSVFMDGSRIVPGSTAAYPRYDRLIRWQ